MYLYVCVYMMFKNISSRIACEWLFPPGCKCASPLGTWLSPLQSSEVNS